MLYAYSYSLPQNYPGHSVHLLSDLYVSSFEASFQNYMLEQYLFQQTPKETHLYNFALCDDRYTVFATPELIYRYLL